MATFNFGDINNIDLEQAMKIRKALNAAYMREWRRNHPEAAQRSRIKAAATLLAKHGYRVEHIEKADEGR